VVEDRTILLNVVSLRSQLKEGDAELIERLLRTVIMLLDLLERKNLSIKKLKAMIFGPRTERRQTRGLAEED
jgi:hypothetical protein